MSPDDFHISGQNQALEIVKYYVYLSFNIKLDKENQTTKTGAVMGGLRKTRFYPQKGDKADQPQPKSTPSSEL